MHSRDDPDPLVRRGWTEIDLGADHPELNDLLVDLHASAAASCPGRTADLVEVRIHQLAGRDKRAGNGIDPDMVTSWYNNDQWSRAERALLEVIEVFAIDPHSVSDEQFEELRRHYTDREVMAIFYHATLTSSFDQLAAALAAPKE